jgi:hypothetical protein
MSDGHGLFLNQDRMIAPFGSGKAIDLGEQKRLHMQAIMKSSS